MMRNLLPFLALLPALTGVCEAQVRVAIKTSRSSYILHEQLDVTIQLLNVAGRPIFLRDSPDSPWLTFQVENVDTHRFAAPLGGRGSTDPLMIEAGQTLEHTVDLRKFHSLDSRGLHQLSAQIFVAELDKYFSSQKVFITIGEGRKLWSQTVGVPGGAGMREYLLLNFRVDKTDFLFLRVRDPQTEAIFTTRPIAPSMTFGEPSAEVDAESRLNVLTLIGPKVFVYYLVDTDGRQLDRVIYRSARTRPTLVRNSSGQVGVAGGFADIPRAVPIGDEAARRPARLSERPPGMPGS